MEDDVLHQKPEEVQNAEAILKNGGAVLVVKRGAREENTQRSTYLSLLIVLQGEDDLDRISPDRKLEPQFPLVPGRFLPRLAHERVKDLRRA